MVRIAFRRHFAPLLLTFGLLNPASLLGQFSYQTNNGNIIITGYDCAGFEATIPATLNGLPVTEIGNRAFANCTRLISVTLGDNIVRIGTEAFKDCTRLATVSGGDKLAAIEVRAFASCTDLASVTTGTNLVYIGDYAFASSGVTNFAFAQSVTNIGSFAFSACPRLFTVTLGKDLSIMGRGAFSGCYVKSLSLSGNFLRVSESAFAHCGDLETVDFNPGITEIGISAFNSCGKLTSVALPTGLTNIGDFAFGNAHSIRNLTLPDTLTRIGRASFDSCASLEGLFIPASLVSLGSGFVGACWSLEEINVDPANTVYSSVDGVLFDRQQTTLLTCPVAKTGTFTLPHTVTNINGGAFYVCGLTNVIMPQGLSSIGEYAFGFSANLTNLVIPNTVTRIGSNAFRGCNSLSTIVIPDSVTTLGEAAFYECGGLTTVTIGKRVTVIEGGTFDATGLKSAYFPGNPPTANGGLPAGATAYFLPGTTGWGSTWGNVPTAPWVLPYPVITELSSARALRTSPLGFIISWATNASVVVEASASLENPAWIPVRTNIQANGWSYFVDHNWTTYPNQFYRVRSN